MAKSKILINCIEIGVQVWETNGRQTNILGEVYVWSPIRRIHFKEINQYIYTLQPIYNLFIYYIIIKEKNWEDGRRGRPFGIQKRFEIREGPIEK